MEIKMQCFKMRKLHTNWFISFLFIEVSAFQLNSGQQTLTKAKDLFMEQDM